MDQEQFTAQTLDYLNDLLYHLFHHGGEFTQSAIDAKNAAITAGIDEAELHEIVLAKWRTLVDSALDDHLLSVDEETRLTEISHAFGLDSERLTEHGYLSKFIQASILRDLQNGEPKTRISLDVPLPFKLLANEVLLWAFPNTRLIEQVTKREVKGGSTGVNLRIMKGVYWRVGAFKAVPVSWDETQQTDTGLLVLTNKHLLFSGPRKNFRIPFTKLASIEPFRDAIEIQRDTQSAKPIILGGIDGQFAYNVIQFA